MKVSLKCLKIEYISVFLMVLVFIISCEVSQPSEAQTKNFIKKIFKESLINGTAYSSLEELCKTYPRRLSGSKGAEDAVQWAKNLMEKRGFDKVYLQEFMTEHWERGSKESAVINLNGKKENLAVLALGRSVATPEKGITAKVIEVSSLNEVRKLGKDKIAGKIVFYNKRFENHYIKTDSGYSATVKVRSRGPSLAASFGAQAVVIRSVGTAKDDYPHTGALKYAADTLKIPAAALSYLAAERLEQALKESPDLTLTLTINSAHYENKPAHNVIGEIKGNEYPEDIILVGGHLDAWDVGEGAHDDGSGCMQAVAALYTLKSLGYQPRNTLRVVLFMNEENGIGGGKKYAEAAAANNEKHHFALESDQGGFSPRGFSFSGQGSSLKKMRSWLEFFPALTIERIIEETEGADITPLHRALGTPISTILPESQRYFDYHHTNRDVFETVNERELELGTASMAALIYLVDQYGL